MKMFENPEIEIQKFIAEDVITSSPGDGNGSLSGETPED